MDQCKQCQHQIDLWNKTCASCGFHLVLEPDEAVRAKYLHGPSLGAMLFTQGWTLGARLYLWFLLSLVPVIGIAVLILCLFFGRNWSWKYGGWKSWSEFQARMKWLDLIAVIWVIILAGVYLWVRS